MRAITGCLLLAFCAAAGAADVGLIKVASGTAHIERGKERLAARPGVAVRQSDVIVTGADGAVGITFADDSLLSTGPNSTLAIDRYAFDATTHKGEFDASLRRGSLAVISGRMVKQSPEAMRVRTPASIMGVRGTQFVVRVEGD